MIPKVIYITHKELTHIKEYSKDWQKLNPDYEIKLFDDELCKEFLLNEYSQLHLDIFNFLQDGPIKSDFWRLCVLYKYGGVYSDADIEPLMPLDFYIDDDIDFCTCFNFKKLYNPHFIVSNAGNKYIKLCIDKYIEYYKNGIPYSYSRYSIMFFFNDIIKDDFVFDEAGTYMIDDKKYRLLKCAYNFGLFNYSSVYNNQRVFNNRYENYDSKNHVFIR